MKRFFFIFVMTLFSAILTGCGQSLEPQKVRWSSQSATGPEEIPEKVKTAIDVAKPVTQISGHKILRGKQSFGPATIDGSWVQVIKDDKGTLLYVGAEVYEDPDLEVQEKIQRMDKNKDKILDRAKKTNRGLRDASFLTEPKVVLRKDLFGFTPFVTVEYVNKEETNAFELALNEQGRVIATRSVAFHMTDGVATVFPGNPRYTSLSEEILRDLNGTGSLVSRWLQLESALEQTPFSEDNYFRYNPDERMFNDVQAYYFADRAMRWFKEELKLELADPLHVRVHIGGAKPTNAAFYYRGRVRLGDGDGRLYRGIPRDPSIVMHEVAHAYVEMVSGLPFEGEGGSYSEAFADFFTASLRDNPKMGEYAYVKGPYKRNLDNNMKVPHDLTGGLYNDSLLVSGTFWDLRKELGEDKTLKVALAFLSRIGAGGTFADFVVVMQDAFALKLNEEDQTAATEVLRRRGWMDVVEKVEQ